MKLNYDLNDWTTQELKEELRACEDMYQHEDQRQQFYDDYHVVYEDYVEAIKDILSKRSGVN